MGGWVVGCMSSFPVICAHIDFQLSNRSDWKCFEYQTGRDGWQLAGAERVMMGQQSEEKKRYNAYKYKIQDTRYNAYKYKIQDTTHTNTKYKIQDTTHTNTKYKIQCIQIQDTRYNAYKIQDTRYNAYIWKQKRTNMKRHQNDLRIHERYTIHIHTKVAGPKVKTSS